MLHKTAKTYHTCKKMHKQRSILSCILHQTVQNKLIITITIIIIPTTTTTITTITTTTIIVLTSMLQMLWGPEGSSLPSDPRMTMLQS